MMPADDIRERYVIEAFAYESNIRARSIDTLAIPLILKNYCKRPMCAYSGYRSCRTFAQSGRLP
jgi:hypothetical protein